MKENSLEQEIKQFHGHPLFLEVLEELKELHSQKNKQYATKGDPLGNFRRCSTAKQKLFDRGFRDDLYRRMTAYALLLASKQEDGACEIVGECKEGTVDSLYEKLRDVVVYYAICMVFEKLRDKELKQAQDKRCVEESIDKPQQKSEDTGCCANSEAIQSEPCCMDESDEFSQKIVDLVNYYKKNKLGIFSEKIPSDKDYNKSPKIDGPVVFRDADGNIIATLPDCYNTSFMIAKN